MNVLPTQVIADMIAFIESLVATVPVLADLVGNVFVGPNPRVQVKSKAYISIIPGFAQEDGEIGDGKMRLAVNMELKIGYKISNRTSYIGPMTGDKVLADSFAWTMIKHIKSRAFREFMAERGIKVPVDHVGDLDMEDFGAGTVGLRLYTLPVSLVTYITNS